MKISNLLLLIIFTTNTKQTFYKVLAFHQRLETPLFTSNNKRHNISYLPSQKMLRCTTTTDNLTTEEDATNYNSIISKSVNLNNCFVRNGILSLTRTIGDVDLNTQRQFVYQVALATESNYFRTQPPAIEIPKEVKYKWPSPSGEKIAIYREEVDGNDNSRQIIEIWTNGGAALENRCVLPSKVSIDSTFGSLSWNSAENAIVYVGHDHTKKEKTSRNFLDQYTSGKSNNNMIGKKFTFGEGIKADWGEKYTSETSNLKIFILNLVTRQVKEIKNIPKNGTPGEVVFAPCDKRIIYTIWEYGDEGNRRLGISYCQQRPCKIYSSSIELNVKVKLEDVKDNEVSTDDKISSPYICLTPESVLSFSPRVAKKEKKIIFLTNSKGFDTHQGCLALHSIDWNLLDGAKPETRRVLVDVVDKPLPQNNGFPGLFLQKLPQECFSTDEKYVYVTTNWNSMSRILKIYLKMEGVFKHVVSNLSDESINESYCSCNLLCTAKEGLIVTQSKPNQPPIVGLLPYHSSDDFSSLCKIAIPSPIAVSSCNSIDSKNTRLKFSYKYFDSPIPSILLLPTGINEETSSIKLIVCPHGGPHVSTCIEFLPTYAYLCEAGKYAILLVNYRGSTGFSQDYLNSLPGFIGDKDVKDLVEATKFVVEETKLIDAERIGICGGSHGGFLGAHCIGQYPDLFKVAALRNPVTDLISMISSTDIPDWCFVESLGKNDNSNYSFIPSKEELCKMYDMSPVSLLHQVKAPTLIALGTNDKRVPFRCQGMEYYYKLKSCQGKVPCKLLLYEGEGHAIDGPLAQSDHWINIKKWFDTFL